MGRRDGWGETIKMEKPKVLVGCPVSDYHEYCTDEFIESVKTLTYDNYDMLLVDNSEDGKFYNSIKDKVPVIRGKYFNSVHERIIYNRNLLRQKVLDERYDYFFSLEQDVIPPRKVIERLLAYKKEIITGVYFKPWDYGDHKKPVAMIWIRHPNDPSKKVTISNDIVLGKHLLKVDFCGLGCLMIHRNVLEKVKFRYDLKQGDGMDDMFFCKDASSQGLEIYADTAIKCHHLVKERPWCWKAILAGKK